MKGGPGGTYLVKQEPEVLALWHQTAKQRGISLNKLIAQAMHRELQHAPHPLEQGRL